MSTALESGTYQIGGCYVDAERCIIGFVPGAEIVPKEQADKIMSALRQKREEMIANGTYLYRTS